MLDGRVMDREDLYNQFNPPTPEFTEWRNDRRGDSTVQMVIFVESHVRFMWFSMKSLDFESTTDPMVMQVRALTEEAWPKALRKSIDGGDRESKSCTWVDFYSCCP